MTTETGLARVPTSIAVGEGQYLDILNPGRALAVVPLSRFVQVLDRIPRFTGHGHLRPRSVASHLCHVEAILRKDLGVKDPAILRAGLLHDLHEAWAGDASRPLKMAMRWLDGDRPSAFDSVEMIGQAAVAKRFDVNFDAARSLVAQADLISMGWEADELFGEGSGEAWGAGTTTVCPPFRGRVHMAFMARARRLGIELG